MWTAVTRRRRPPPEFTQTEMSAVAQRRIARQQCTARFGRSQIFVDPETREAYVADVYGTSRRGSTPTPEVSSAWGEYGNNRRTTWAATSKGAAHQAVPHAGDAPICPTTASSKCAIDRTIASRGQGRRTTEGVSRARHDGRRIEVTSRSRRIPPEIIVPRRRKTRRYK